MKCLGKRKMYNILVDRIGETKIISKCSASVYEKSGRYEWLSVPGQDCTYKLCAGFGGSYLSLSVYDFDFNRVSKDVLNGYKVQSVLAV